MTLESLLILCINTDLTACSIHVHASINTEYIMSELMSFQCTFIKCPNSSIVF